MLRRHVPRSSPAPAHLARDRRRATLTSLRRLLTLLLLLPFAGTATAQVTSIGLSSVRAQRFVNEDLGEFEPEVFDQFGRVLVTGDFDGDGADDLATAIPNDDGVPGDNVFEAGAVVVRYGIAGRGLAPGLATTFLADDPPAEADSPENFGSALAACDFNGDGRDDLAVGAPGETVGTTPDAGAVVLFYGGAIGVSMPHGPSLSQGSGGFPGVAEAADKFGFALACGDFNADGRDDLAVGAPFEPAGTVQFAGTVTILPGSPGGLTAAGAFILHQDTPGVLDAAETLDLFGYTLAAGDWNGDGRDDLAIGAPGEDETRGAVHILFGSAGGLALAGNLLYFEDSIGGLGEAEDGFGVALASGDFDGDARDDLAIGIPFENFGIGNSILDCGQVNVLYGAAGGFDPARNQFLAQDNILGAATSEANDLFGLSLAAGDFDADGRDDLAIGAPGEFVTGPRDGAATVIMGSPSGLNASRHRGLAAGFAGFPGNAAEHDRQLSHALAAGDFDGDGHADLALGAPLEDVDGIDGAGAEMVIYGSLFADGFETGPGEILWSSIQSGGLPPQDGIQASARSRRPLSQPWRPQAGPRRP